MNNRVNISGSELVGDVGMTESTGHHLKELPLVVDLDGTLVRTDLLIESALILLRRQPLYVFALPVWLTRGIARFKREISLRTSLEIATLPWRREFIEYLKGQRSGGRSLVLATGSDERIAKQTADYLNLFDLVLSSDGETNLCGELKTAALVGRFGVRGFDYAGDGGGVARRDLSVWAAARKGILVGATPEVAARAARTTVVDRVFTNRRDGLAEHLRVLRPAHWLKNLLVFVPILAAHRFEGALLWNSFLAFVAFGFIASGGYLVNDLIDLGADRRHPHKRLRAFAAGDLSLTYALTMIPFLLLTGCILSTLISPAFLGVGLAYFALSVTYSVCIKHIALLDVLFLACLYTVRIMAGSVATGIWLSHWLAAFSVFLFFSLALVKRYAELVIMRSVDHDGARARAYELGDAELLATMGTSSGYLAAMVLALYIASDKAQTLYHHREVLWLLCLLLLYWISHVWLTAHRGKMNDDPLVFATSDRTSRVLIALMVLTAVVAL